MRVPNQTKKLLTLAIALLVGFTAQAQLTADFTANTTSGCNTPFTVQFTDLSTPGANPIAFWIWHFGNGATSTLQNPVATYSAPGIYDVKLVVYDNFTDGDSIVKVGYIEVGNNMVLTGTPTPITCFNNGEMTVSATGGTAPYTYSWSNGQTTQTATGLTPYYAQFGVGVTVTDDNGCNAVQVFPVPY